MRAISFDFAQDEALKPHDPCHRILHGLRTPNQTSRLRTCGSAAALYDLARNKRRLIAICALHETAPACGQVMDDIGRVEGQIVMINDV